MPGKHVVLKLSEIDLGKRGRVVYEDIPALAEAITQAGGLINPITVVEDPVAELRATMVDKEKKYLLKTGGRRFRAHEHLKKEEIECMVWLNDMSEAEFRLIELMENIQRKALSWQEEVDMKEELVRLTRTVEEDQTLSVAVVAKRAGISESVMSRDIKLKKAMDKMPELKEAATKADAHKALNRMEEQAILREKARRVAAQEEASGNDALKKALIDSYIVGNALEHIKKVPDNLINFVELDPPYAIDYEELHKGRECENPNVENFTEWKEDEYTPFLTEIAKECFRVQKDLSWGICWCSVWRLEETAKVLRNAGYDVAKSPLIWHKPGQGRNRTPSSKFTVDYEVALYFRKGKAQLNIQGPASVYAYQTEKNSRHPTQKPVGLLCSVMENFCAPGSKILVPFLGSGNTLLAARQIKCLAFGFDLSQEYKDGYILAVEEKFLSQKVVAEADV